MRFYPPALIAEVKIELILTDHCAELQGTQQGEIEN
jgi:hypothetical protein